MAIETKRPSVKESVGAQYICFANTNINGEFLGDYETDVEKTEVVKSVTVTENSTSTPIRASGKDYEVVNSTSSTEISVEVIAFYSETLAKMRADVISENGLILSGGSLSRPYFAYGKVVKLMDGAYRYEWYPKCQLTANTDDITTSELEYKEQNDTLTIKAMPFNENGDIKCMIDSTFKVPAGMTEEKFFAKPVLGPADIL